MIRLMLVATTLLLSGCALSTVYPQPGVRGLAPVAPGAVKIYAGEPAHYRVVGFVVVNKMGDGEDAATLLKEKAGALGANAVIHVQLTKLTSFDARAGLSGVAVLTN